VREKINASFAGLAQRTAEVMKRCCGELQALADQMVSFAS
jgi:hypothetical protein